MKYAKMLGLAALAALALMAFVGAGSASAKVCSTAGVGASCGAGHGNVYTGAVKASLTSGKTAQLVSGFITVNCSESSATGEITNGETGAGNISSLTFGGCTSGLGACTAKTSASSVNKWPVTVTGEGTTSGKMVVKNVTGEFTCAGVTCKYVAAEAGKAGEIVVAGGEPGEIKATKVVLTKEEGSSFLCSNTATWSGEYLISTPNSVFIT